MASDKKHESMSSLKASTERYKRHNDRVASGAKVGTECRHKFIDTNKCVRCGWVAPDSMNVVNHEERCSKCSHWKRGMFGDKPCPVGGEHLWLSVPVSDSPVGVMTGAQAVAAMTGAGVPVEQVELRKVIVELEGVWLSIDATLKRCRVLLETMKGEKS